MCVGGGGGGQGQEKGRDGPVQRVSQKCPIRINRLSIFSQKKIKRWLICCVLLCVDFVMSLIKIKFWGIININFILYQL